MVLLSYTSALRFTTKHLLGVSWIFVRVSQIYVPILKHSQINVRHNNVQP